jgi:hypothetical protein
METKIPKCIIYHFFAKEKYFFAKTKNFLNAFNKNRGGKRRMRAKKASTAAIPRARARPGRRRGSR